MFIILIILVILCIYSVSYYFRETEEKLIRIEKKIDELKFKKPQDVPDKKVDMVH